MLFDGAKEDKGLIRLPSRSQAEGVKAFVEQLCTWFPQSKAKQDCVMALWFAETKARELVNGIESVFHVENEFASPRDKERSVVIDLDYMGQSAHASGGSAQWWS